MKQPKRRESPIIAVLLCAGLVVLWIMFAPMQFGGRTSYVVVNGISMEPKFHRGDLALVRKSNSYNVGDIVVYRHPTIGPVIHRIIGRDGDRYVFKGDNNDFVDPYEPTQAELIGKFWFHIPMVGQPFTKLHNRLVVAGLVALSGLIVLLPFALGESKTGRRRKTKRSQDERREPAMNTQSENGQTLLTLLVAVALASLVLGGLALSRPLDRTVTKTADYQQAGTFSYSAPAPSGVYDANGVTTGDPIFTQITNNVDFRFAYELTSQQATDVSGTASMQAVVSDSSGWKRSLELLPPQAFTGTRFIAVGTLDLSQVRDVIKQFEQTTGITSHQYSVSIVPQAQLHGTIAGAKLETTYSPALKFTLDQDSMSLVDSSGSSDAGASSPLKPSQSGQANYTAQATNVLSLLTFSLSVSTARITALSGLIISLFGLLWYSLLALHGSRADEASRIKSRYGALLIDVDDANFENTSRVIDVVRFEDLLRLAEREERMIMHQFYGGIDRYYVQDESITYRYRVAPRSEPKPDGRSSAHLATGDLR
ncbi:MAG TPA: signal peptidase I [Nitrolancea sp.]